MLRAGADRGLCGLRGGGVLGRVWDSHSRDLAGLGMGQTVLLQPVCRATRNRKQQSSPRVVSALQNTIDWVETIEI